MEYIMKIGSIILTFDDYWLKPYFTRNFLATEHLLLCNGGYKDIPPEQRMKHLFYC